MLSCLLDLNWGVGNEKLNENINLALESLRKVGDIEYEDINSKDVKAYIKDNSRGELFLVQPKNDKFYVIFFNERTKVLKEEKCILNKHLRQANAIIKVYKNTEGQLRIIYYL